MCVLSPGLSASTFVYGMNVGPRGMKAGELLAGMTRLL